jgi:hypothetical protein
MPSRNALMKKASLFLTPKSDIHIIRENVAIEKPEHKHSRSDYSSEHDKSIDVKKMDANEDEEEN